MIISGKILNNETGKPIPFASVIVVDKLQSSTGVGTQADANGNFYLNDPKVSYPNSVIISSVGYNQLPFALSNENFAGMTFELVPYVYELPPVVVTGSKKQNYAWLLLLAVPLLAKKKAAVGLTSKEANGWILTAGLALVAIKGIDMIQGLITLLGGDGEGAGNVKDEQNNPYSPWKPGFLTAIPNGQSYKIITEAKVQEFITTIHNAFTVVQDNYNQILGVFNQLSTQSQVAWLSKKFTEKYKEDLLTFLADGGGVLPWDGLSDKHLAQLTDLVSNLPKYN